MNPGATFTVAFGQSGRPRLPRSHSSGRTPRVARHLALAHEIERRIRAGEFDDLAHAARAFGLTRARVTQLSNLTLLAPAIQAEILAIPPITQGRDPITERTLRPIVAEPVWERQVEMWRAFTAARGDDQRLSLNGKCAGEENFATAHLSELDDVE